jgi:hypothetical protein
MGWDPDIWISNMAHTSFHDFCPQATPARRALSSIAQKATRDQAHFVSKFRIVGFSGRGKVRQTGIQVNRTMRCRR